MVSSEHIKSLWSLLTTEVTNLPTISLPSNLPQAHHQIPPDHLKIAALLDHTLLKADATKEDVSKLCAEAKEHHLGAICVNLSNLQQSTQLLVNSSVKKVVVVGFPLGATSSEVKAFETAQATSSGAQEIDMVLNIGALRSKKYQLVFDDIKAVVNAANTVPVKVILETCLLSTDEKIIACLLSKAAGAAFVKTSTGFSKSGATVEDVQLMRTVVGSEMGVKASGGVSSYEKAIEMINAGATRIGTSSSLAIINHSSSSSSY